MTFKPPADYEIRTFQHQSRRCEPFERETASKLKMGSEYRSTQLARNAVAAGL